MDNIELIINIIIISLLIPTILYAYRLNKNLEAMRKNQNSLAELVRLLNDATIKAEDSIPKLKTATQTTSGELREVVDNAKNLKDDLMFINERADNLADRLENVIHNGRQIDLITNVPPQTTDTSATTPPSEAELELLKALRTIK